MEVTTSVTVDAESGGSSPVLKDGAQVGAVCAAQLEFGGAPA